MDKKTIRRGWVAIGCVLLGSVIYGVTGYICGNRKVSRIAPAPCTKITPSREKKQFPGDTYEIHPSEEVKAAAEKLKKYPFAEHNERMYGLSLAPVLMTDRLVIRPMNSGDIDDLTATFADEETVYMLAFMPWPFPKRRVTIYMENLSYAIERGNSLYWAITEPKDNRLIGVIGLTLDYTNERAEMHYWLLPEARGKGYMTEVAKRTIDYAFRDLNMHRIDINCLTVNKASQRVMEKCGFVFEAEKIDFAKKGDKFENMKFFYILRKDYFSDPSKK